MNIHFGSALYIRQGKPEQVMAEISKSVEKARKAGKPFSYQILGGTNDKHEVCRGAFADGKDCMEWRQARYQSTFSDMVDWVRNYFWFQSDCNPDFISDGKAVDQTIKSKTSQSSIRLLDFGA